MEKYLLRIKPEGWCELSEEGGNVFGSYDAIHVRGVTAEISFMCNDLSLGVLVQSLFEVEYAKDFNDIEQIVRSSGATGVTVSKK
jgi:hypothetical protein